MENLIKSTNNLNKEDMNILREKVISEYARKKGWNKDNLTPNQMLEIVQTSEYKSPGMLNS